MSFFGAEACDWACFFVVACLAAIDSFSGTSAARRGRGLVRGDGHVGYGLLVRGVFCVVGGLLFCLLVRYGVRDSGPVTP